MVLQHSPANYQAKDWQPVTITPVNVDKEPDFDFDLQQEIHQLESLILDGVHIPLTGLTVIDEQQIFEQLSLIKANIPTVLATAIEIVAHKQEIIQEAVSYAQNLVESAQAKANQILNESAIIRKAELEAIKIKVQTEQECQQIQEETREETEKWRQLTMTECEEMQKGADDYADAVLGNLEQQLQDMLTVIRKGRQELVDLPSAQEIPPKVN